MFDGIIFDVDGTLWDSTPVVEEAWNQAFDDYGIAHEKITADRLKGLFGLPMDDIIADLLPEATAEERAAIAPFCFKYEHEYLEKKAGVLYPELEETLCALSKKYKLFIVSNCQAGYIELFLKKTGFGPYITDHLCPGDTDLLKADNIKLIAERNGLKNPVYVGDTGMDEKACEDAGVPFIFATYGFGKAKNPINTIDKPLDLVDIL